MSLTVSCTICMANYDEKDGDDFVSIKCGHAFHRSCLLEWKISSRKMECPECRSKYTAKALKKLFLHTLPKDDDEISLELQEEKKRYSKLMTEMEQVRGEKRKLENDLLNTHNECMNLRQKQFKLSEDMVAKIREMNLVTTINDDYLKINNKLHQENQQLKLQNEKLINENSDLKLKQVQTAKPFVDLTCDDDSDVEFVETNPKPVEIIENKSPSSPDVIQVEESTESETVDETPKTSDDLFQPNIDFKLDYETIEEFGKFILEQI